MTDTVELLDLATEAVAVGVALLRAEPAGQVRTKSSATDLVTDMDGRVESVVVAALLDARPSDAVLGEEGGERRGSTGVRWLIDPIDGTTNYVYGYPPHAVSVAAEVDGQLAAGVVADVSHDDLYRARLGAGAECNGTTITASSRAELATALVATGFSYEPDRRRAQAQVLTDVLPRVRDIRRAGAATVDLCWVASGRVDAYYEQGLKPWDWAAGGLIAREAGARVRGIEASADPPGYVLAAAPAIFDALEALLDDAGAADT